MYAHTTSAHHRSGRAAARTTFSAIGHLAFVAGAAALLQIAALGAVLYATGVVTL